jgi:hypothetical protein
MQKSVAGSNPSTTKKKKSVAFLYINDEQSEKEVKKIIPFPKASKRIKYLRLTIEAKTCTLKTIKHC